MRNIDIVSRKLGFIWSSLLFVISGGCAHHAQIQVIPSGSVVQISYSEVGSRRPDARTTGESIGDGAVAGGAAGADAGFQMSELCGGFALFCMPIFVVGGLVSGAVVGAPIGAALGLPKEKADSLDEIILAVFSDSNQLRTPFHDALTSRYSNFWIVSDDGVYPEISLSPPSAVIKQGLGDSLKVRIAVEVTVRYSAEEKRGVTRPLLFLHDTGSFHIDEWIANEGVLFRDEVLQAVQTVADMIFQRLSASTGIAIAG